MIILLPIVPLRENGNFLYQIGLKLNDNNNNFSYFCRFYFNHRKN